LGTTLTLAGKRKTVKLGPRPADVVPEGTQVDKLIPKKDNTVRGKKKGGDQHPKDMYKGQKRL